MKFAAKERKKAKRRIANQQPLRKFFFVTQQGRMKMF